MTQECKFEASIHRFLDSDLLTGMLVDGHWGSGKTYAVTRAAERYAKETGRKVIHTSLYDVDSVAEIESATILARFGTDDPSDLEDRVFKLASKFSGLLNDKIPAVASALATKDSVVIMDDLERKGPNLRLQSILSFASRLQETQGCRVVIICNISQLDTTDEETLRKNSDKCIQKTLKIERETTELIKIAVDADRKLPDSAMAELTKFKIANIRLLRIIIERCLEILEAVKDDRPEAQAYCVKQCTILSLCHAGIEGWPSMKELLEDNELYGLNFSSTQEGAASYPNLGKHNYNYTTDFERSIADGIINGWFDKEKLKVGLQVNVPVDKRKTSSVGRAWSDFHHSLIPNDSEFVDMMYTAHIESADQVDVLSFNGVLSLFSELGQSDLIPGLVDNYISKNSEREIEFFDLHTHAPFSREPNEYLAKKFENEFAKRSRNLDIQDVLLKLEKREWYNKSVEMKLLSATSEELGNLLLESRLDVRNIVQSLASMKTSPPSGNQSKIQELISDVFSRLSESSDLNSLRMKSFLSR